MFANILILLALSLAWATNYVFIAWVDKALPPLTATAAITLVAAGFLFVGVRVVMRRPLWPVMRANPWVPLVMAATAVALPQLSTVMAEDRISSDLATVIGTTVPILTFLVSACILRTTKATWLNFLGVAIAVGGIVIFADPAQLLRQSAEVLGIVIMMAGGVVFVINGLFAAQKAAHLDQYALTVWIVALAAVALSIAAISVEGVPTQRLPMDSLIGLVLSGMVGTGLAYLFYYLLIARAGAAFTSLYAFLVPPMGVAATALVADGSIGLRHGISVVIILLGLWLVLRRAPATDK